MKSKMLWLVGAAAFLAQAPRAEAILVRCPDGTVVGPLIGPNPCWGHYGPGIVNSGPSAEQLPYCDEKQGGSGGFGVADPIVASVHESGCRERDPSEAGGGKGNNKPGTQPPAKPAVLERDIDVDYAFRSAHDCRESLSGGTAAAGGSAHLPGGSSDLEKFCQKLFGDEGTGSRKVTLTVSFRLRAERCEEQLTTRIQEAAGTPRLSEPAESFCKDLFGGNGGPSTSGGGSGGSKGGSSGEPEVSEL